MVVVVEEEEDGGEEGRRRRMIVEHTIKMAASQVAMDGDKIEKAEMGDGCGERRNRGEREEKERERAGVRIKNGGGICRVTQRTREFCSCILPQPVLPLPHRAYHELRAG